mgnify:CR=1 FL=1
MDFVEFSFTIFIILRNYFSLFRLFTFFALFLEIFCYTFVILLSSNFCSTNFDIKKILGYRPIGNPSAVCLADGTYDSTIVQRCQRTPGNSGGSDAPCREPKWHPAATFDVEPECTVLEVIIYYTV